MADFLRVIGLINCGRPSAFGYPEQYGLFGASSIHDRVEVELAGLLGKITVPFLGQSYTAAVVPDHREQRAQLLPEMPEIGPLPLHLEVGEVAEYPDEQRAVSINRIRDLDPVSGCAKLNVLRV